MADLGFMLSVKLAGIFSIWIISQLFGLFPLQFLKAKNPARLLSISNCMAGGVFIGAGFLHLFPDAVELTDQYSVLLKGKYNYPTAFILAAAGFLMILFLEHMILLPAGGHGHGHGDSEGHQHHHGHSHAVIEPVVDEYASDASSTSSGAAAPLLAKGAPHQYSVNVDLIDEAAVPPTPTPPPKTAHPDAQHSTEAGFMAYLVMIVLSFHSLIEGLALGSTSSSGTLVAVLIGVLCVEKIYLCLPLIVLVCYCDNVAILAHKWSEAFAVGVSLVKGVSKRTVVILITIYAVMTPVGIGIGMAVQALASQAEIYEAIFIAIATGSFLYVGMVEILPEELRTLKDKWIKWAMILGAFTLMAVVRLWA